MRYFADKIASIFFQRAITQKRGIILSRKKIHVSYFFMRNPYMKFQNSSIHGFKVMLFIKKREERTDGRKDRRTDGRTDGRMDGRTNNPEAICPSNFFEVGGIMNVTPGFMEAEMILNNHKDEWLLISSQP